MHVRLGLRCRSLFAVCGLVEILLNQGRSHSRRRRAPLRTGEASESFSSCKSLPRRPHRRDARSNGRRSRMVGRVGQAGAVLRTARRDGASSRPSVEAGLIGLDKQARALGLPRSTTWKILKGDHKASGLSAMVISRMLSAPRLPPVVRTKILEYVREKTDGFMGTAREKCLDSRLGFGTPTRPGCCRLASSRRDR